MTIQLQQVEVLDNPAAFTDEFKFRITFDCVSPGVKEEIEWKLVYVGSADNEDNDQELDSILVGPVRVGKNRFTFQAPPPDPSRIPKDDLLDVTVVLLTCLYKDEEFIRIGYYVHNEYIEEINENTIIKPQNIQRNILADKPRVTRFNISWDNDEKCEKENKFTPLPKKDVNQQQQQQQQQNEEMKDNDEQYYDPQEDYEEEIDLDDDDDEDIEEDLDETEDDDDDDNNNNNNNNNENNKNINIAQQENNNDNDTHDDDEDIDMQ